MQFRKQEILLVDKDLQEQRYTLDSSFRVGIIKKALQKYFYLTVPLFSSKIIFTKIKFRGEEIKVKQVREINETKYFYRANKMNSELHNISNADYLFYLYFGNKFHSLVKEEIKKHPDAIVKNRFGHDECHLQKIPNKPYVFSNVLGIMINAMNYETFVIDCLKTNKMQRLFFKREDSIREHTLFMISLDSDKGVLSRDYFNFCF